ncbi:unnamed protein product [Arctogadus glacialis]
MLSVCSWSPGGGIEALGTRKRLLSDDLLILQTEPRPADLERGSAGLLGALTGSADRRGAASRPGKIHDSRVLCQMSCRCGRASFGFPGRLVSDASSARSSVDAASPSCRLRGRDGSVRVEVCCGGPVLSCRCWWRQQAPSAGCLAPPWGVRRAVGPVGPDQDAPWAGSPTQSLLGPG